LRFAVTFKTDDADQFLERTASLASIRGVRTSGKRRRIDLRYAVTRSEQSLPNLLPDRFFDLSNLFLNHAFVVFGFASSLLIRIVRDLWNSRSAA
jgi:hypothetical protein